MIFHTKRKKDGPSSVNLAASSMTLSSKTPFWPLESPQNEFVNLTPHSKLTSSTTTQKQLISISPTTGTSSQLYYGIGNFCTHHGDQNIFDVLVNCALFLMAILNMCLFCSQIGWIMVTS